MKRDLRFIVADDDDLVGGMTQMMVQKVFDQYSRDGRGNVSVDRVYDGQQLFDKVVAEGIQYEGIFTDYHMPRMNGGKAVQEIRGAGILVPAVLMSGGGKDMDAIIATRLPFLPKPYRMTDLEKMVREVWPELFAQQSESTGDGSYNTQ